jgi:hypothetical protein
MRGNEKGEARGSAFVLLPGCLFLLFQIECGEMAGFLLGVRTKVPDVESDVC